VVELRKRKEFLLVNVK